nr:MAG TPA_asm: hypothetical protein [Bacteriophage sp.]
MRLYFLFLIYKSTALDFVGVTDNTIFILSAYFDNQLITSESSFIIEGEFVKPSPNHRPK